MLAFAKDGHFWDPLLDIFDFSLKFEEVILQLAPSSLAIVCFVLFILHYRHAPVQVRPSLLLWAKAVSRCPTPSNIGHPTPVANHGQVAAAAIIACQATSLGMRSKSADSRTDTSIAAFSVDLVASLGLAGAIYIGHRHLTRSSGILALFLFFSMLVDITKSRSYFLRPHLESLGALAAATAALRLCLMVLEEVSKVSLLVDENVRKAAGSETTGGYFGRAFLVFLLPMLKSGYTSRLGPDNLVRLGLEFSSRTLHARLQRQWKKKIFIDSKYRLVLTCIYVWKWELFLVFLPRLVWAALEFAQPFLIQQIINIVERQQNGRGEEVGTGERLGLQAATLLIYLGITLFKTATAHRSNRLVTQVRGAVVSELMEKLHNISEEDAKKSAVLTHMSTDIETITEGLSTLMFIPVTAFEVGMGVFFLLRFIQYSCFFVLIPVFLASGLSFIVGNYAGAEMGKWNKAIEVRVAKTTEVLSQLPSIKMLGLGPVVAKLIHQLRVDEMRTSRPFRFLMTVINTTSEFVHVATPATVISVSFFWRGFDGTMQAGQVFPTLAVVGLIEGPTLGLIHAYPEVMSMLACFGRIQSYLDLAERADARTKGDGSPENASAKSDANGKNIRNSHEAIQYADASFGPAAMDTPLLSNVNFGLPRGSMSGVVGSTGSGKSSFFKSILGETKKTSGAVYTDDVNVAYCGPDVWLRDTSIRENIVGYLKFDAERYAMAIRRCQLEQDIAQFAEGDDYVVGPNGFNLSGGQRQRVALARAVFAECDITVIDDGLSSLDRSTATAILQGLCGKDGVLKKAGSTVVLSTYLPEILDVANQLVVLDNGKATVDKDFRKPERNAMITDLLSSAASASHEIEEAPEIDRSWLEDLELPSREEEEYVRIHGSWGLHLVFIDSIGRGKCLALVMFAFVLSLAEGFGDIYIRIWTQLDPTNGIYIVGYVAIAIAACVFMAIAYWLLYTLYAVRAAIGLHKQMLDVTMQATIGFLTSTKSGNIINRFSQDTNLFSKILPYYLFRVLYVSSAAIIMLGIILSSASYMCIAIPFIFAAIYYVQRFYLHTSRQMRHLDLEEKAPLYTFFSETATGTLYIQSYGWRKPNMERGYQLLDNSQQPFYLMLCIQQWLSMVLCLLSTAIALILVSISVWVQNSTNGAAVGLSFLGVMALQQTLQYVIEAWTGSETSIAGLARLEKYKKETPREPNPPERALPESWPKSGQVGLTEVTARYRYVFLP